MTERQDLGVLGEELVAKKVRCLRCKRSPGGKLRRLPANFKCADVICEFCGWLAQVKAHTSRDVERLPTVVLGAAWGPQQERMVAGIYFPLFIVALEARGARASRHAIYFIPVDLQTPEMFKPRKPLSGTARRAGWQGYMIDLVSVANRVVRLA